MNKTILQVPMSRDLKISAEKQAIEQGFSSLQEMVRVFLKKLSQKTLSVKFEEEVQLSPKAIKRYDKMIDEMESGKNIYHAESFDDFMKQLRHASKS